MKFVSFGGFNLQMGISPKRQWKNRFGLSNSPPGGARKMKLMDLIQMAISKFLLHPENLTDKTGLRRCATTYCIRHHRLLHHPLHHHLLHLQVLQHHLLHLQVLHHHHLVASATVQVRAFRVLACRVFSNLLHARAGVWMVREMRDLKNRNTCTSCCSLKCEASFCHTAHLPQPFSE